MSQRRGRNDQEDAPLTKVLTPIEGGELKLDEGDDTDADADAADMTKEGVMAPLSIDEKYSREREAAKIKHWKDSPFAVGLVEVSWNDEFSRGSFSGMSQIDIDPDSAGCNCCSSFCCGRLGAVRVGNMAVLKQTQEWVEEVEEDEETGEQKTRRFTRPKLQWMMGPYWPMLIFITYPLIFGVSFWTMISAIPSVPFILQLVWAVCTMGLIYALAMTAFRDPGILYRHDKPPPQSENSWRWNDTAQTYRPRGAFYDPDCAVVVEGFDHT
jgi:hypothetical protein